MICPVNPSRFSKTRVVVTAVDTSLGDFSGPPLNSFVLLSLEPVVEQTQKYMSWLGVLDSCNRFTLAAFAYRAHCAKSD